jgi:hypothetical protein
LAGALPRRDLQFAGWGCESEDSCNFFITSDSKWAQTGSVSADPFYLIDAAFHVGFSYYEDGDTWDTQEAQFRGQEVAAMVKVLGGVLAVANLAVREALTWDLTTALDNANISQVHLVKNKDGKWDTALLTAA